MRTIILRVVCLVWACPWTLVAQTISLNTYLDLIQSRHPFFRQEALAHEIELKRQERIRGEEDWVTVVKPSYIYNDVVDVGFGAVDQFDNARLEAGMGREVWKTGGHIDFLYDFNFRAQDVNESRIVFPGQGDVDISGPSRFFRTGVSASYTQPLLQNWGGGLSRLAYELQGYTAEQTDLFVQENQEGFLLEQALRFMDWIRRDKQLEIARRRLELAEEELNSTRRKLEARIVEEVDVFRAKDAALEAKRNVRLVESFWKARQAELAVQAQEKSLLASSPKYDLYRLRQLPDPELTVSHLRKRARILRQLGRRHDQLKREREGLSDLEQAELNLVVSAGLKDGESDVDEAVDFNQPDATIALEYRYPLGNRTARADVQRNALELNRIESQIEDAALALESQARSMLTQLSELEGVLALNKEQVQTSANKTKAEKQLYEQGRSQLNFVIQSRDQEAIAQQTYALNAVDYHSLWLQFQALVDRLLPAEAE